jgi:hypothetical protein
MPEMKQFRPSDWRDSGSCYPCIIFEVETGELFMPCDPWTLPEDGDYSGWLSISAKEAKRLLLGATT